MNQTLLDLAQEILGWPKREDVFHPSGAAKIVMVKAADRKIGNSVRRFNEAADARVGILTGNPGSDTTEPPMALVCEFPRVVSQSVLREAQRLAWNFSLSPLLITVEPHLIRSFTCCEQDSGSHDPDQYEIQSINKERLSLSEEAAQALHWVSLISGAFYQANEARFRRDLRADQQLRLNMKYVREKLVSDKYGLDEDVCHDLLARVIFIQFLMDRKDREGKSALDSSKLEELTGHASLGQVLRDKESAYGFFRYLNQRFNGDLFAGDDISDQDGGLVRERALVGQNHLDLLAELVEGNLAMETRQVCLWKQYAFDVIPLEFISSIYEEFVSKRAKREGAYYTPQHLVDYLLDGVLPWNGRSWDLKILDPACGSAVFLVKAFQRLVHRWRAAHQGNRPSPEVLRELLERNILGVDRSDHAVKVASFSLYLAMCDYIEPEDLWDNTSFPKLCGQRIICSDFFTEEVPGVRTLKDAGTYDLIIGNPPWGKGSLTELAGEWGKRNKWPAAQKDLGPLFLPKSAALAKPDGAISMLQPATALLFNRRDPAPEFRKRFFDEFKVEEVTNLAAVRFHHFEKSDSPVCIVTFRNVPPDGEPFAYICPKPGRANYEKNLITIDPQDVNSIFPREAATQPEVWTALMWGGRRDLEVIRSLKSKNTLGKLIDGGLLNSRGRIIRGKTRQRAEPELLHRPIIQRHTRLEQYFLYLPASHLEKNTDLLVHYKDTRDLSALEPPQLILKQSWSARTNRFVSFVVQPDQEGTGVITSLSFVSVHAPRECMPLLETACLTYNSIFTVYYLLLTSGPFAAERPKVLEEEALSVPIPEVKGGLLNQLRDYDDVDDEIRRAFSFSDVEWALIEDVANYTVPYFKSKASYPDDPTNREETKNSDIGLYAEFFLKVLKAGFGDDKRITCVEFVEPRNQDKLPVRLFAVHLESPLEIEYKQEEIDSERLYRCLGHLHSNLMDLGLSNSGGIFFQRVARVYDIIDIGGKRVPTVYIIKPDRIRYWTRSMALRDADDVAADIMGWSQKSDVSPLSQGAPM